MLLVAEEKASGRNCHCSSSPNHPNRDRFLAFICSKVKLVGKRRVCRKFSFLFAATPVFPTSCWLCYFSKYTKAMTTLCVWSISHLHDCVCYIIQILATSCMCGTSRNMNISILWSWEMLAGWLWKSGSSMTHTNLRVMLVAPFPATSSDSTRTQ